MTAGETFFCPHCSQDVKVRNFVPLFWGHLKISVVPIATSAKNPCTPKEEKWQVLYPMDL